MGARSREGSTREEGGATVVKALGSDMWPAINGMQNCATRRVCALAAECVFSKKETTEPSWTMAPKNGPPLAAAMESNHSLRLFALHEKMGACAN